MSLEIITKTNKLPQYAAAMNQKMKDALLELGGEIYDDAYEIVPVRTGKLQRSLFVEETEDGEVVVGAGEDYSVYVELGTRFMAAEPYLQPAFDRHVHEIESLAQKAARGALGE